MPVIPANAGIQRYTLPSMDPRIREDDKSAVQVRPFDKLRDRVTKAHIPKSKGANGAVAVGLPHRNRSVFKHAHINKQEVKDRSISHEITRKENQEWIPAFARMTKAFGEGWPRACEAKGHLPAEEGWVMEKKEKKERKERRKKKTKVVLNPSAPNTPGGNTLDK